VDVVSAAALRAGFASASALPLRLREVTLGALNLLSITRAPMDEADVIIARAFADLAALSIVQHRASAEAQRLNEQPVRRATAASHIADSVAQLLAHEA
jgi:GAF domain-containing protein